MKTRSLFNEMEQFKPDIVRFTELCDAIKTCMDLRIWIFEEVINEYNELVKKLES